MNFFAVSENNITEIAHFVSKILNEGGLIIYPTSTLYGFGASLSNKDGLHRINRIKNREAKKPQILLIKFEWISDYIANYEKYLPLLESLWPGPYTFLLPHKIKSPFEPDNLIAFRVSEHAFVNKTLEYIGDPISSTSVNRAGEKPLLKRKKIVDMYSDIADAIVYEQKHLYLPFWNEKKVDDYFSPSTMINAEHFPESVEIIRCGKADLSNIGRIFPNLKVIRSYEK
ncbi:MAG: L-threonylcarbamoyladenylate synthase [Candidatus Zixiibacteriota bacterium]